MSFGEQVNWPDTDDILGNVEDSGLQFSSDIVLPDYSVENIYTPQRPNACGGKSLLRFNRSRTRQNFELVHIIGPVQNFGPPARNFGPLKAEFAWREWRKTLGGHVANWAGLSGFSPRENKISHTFFIDCINKYFKYLMYTIPMIVMAYLMVGC